MNDEKRIIEINGVKIEVDLRTAKQVEHYKVGDPVKLLVKDSYGSKYNTYPAVIVGFADFRNLPSIEVLYLKEEFDGFNMKFMTVNNQTEDVEIAPFYDYEVIFSRAEIMDKLQKQIESLSEKVRCLESKKRAFDKYFNQAFEDTGAQV